MADSATLLGLWRAAVAQAGDDVLAIEGDRAYRYGEVDESSSALAGGLRRLGLEPGDRVAFVAPNCIEFVVAYLAVQKAGCVALPINVRLAGEEMAFILNDAAAAAVFVHADTRSPVEGIFDDVPSLRRRIAIGFESDGYDSYDRWVRSDPLGEEADPGPGDVAAVVYTSGTTGRPKGAMITQGNVAFNAASAELGMGFRPDDRHLLAVVLFHVTGLNTVLPAAIRHRSSVVITASPSPAEQLKLIEKHRATTLLGVPTTYIMMAGLPDIEAMDLRHLRLIGYSGAPMPIDTIRTLRDRFPSADLMNFYGLTETTSIASSLDPACAVSHAASIGKPVPRVAFMIADDAGRALGPNEVGELCIRGGNVFKGYLNRPEATAEAFFDDGWFRSGDAATIDDDGFVFLRGRKKEMIIVGGENVYPVEVENVLCAHPAVREAAVVGMPSDVFGELVRAVVVLTEGAEATSAGIRRHCAERLASFKVPHRVDFVDALPRNPSGKVVRRWIGE
ncbi:MAG: class I adenylate-forming enzyme family protein [Planctomycetota bacterium]